MALASNTNPHSVGGGGVMPGCVVLVSNLNEKVCIFAYWAAEDVCALASLCFCV